MKHDKNIDPENQADHEKGLEIIRVLNLRRKGDNGRIDTTQGDKNPCGLARTLRAICDPDHEKREYAYAFMLAVLLDLAPRAQEAKRFSKADWETICTAIRKATV